MVTLEAFLRGVAKIKSEAPTYREGGDGSDCLLYTSDAADEL